MQLAQIARALDGIAFRRERSGAVRVYGPVGSLRHAGRRWSASPSIGDAIGRILQAAPMVDQGLLLKLLEFAYYVLSPWYIGATLVWLLSDRNPFETKVDLQPFELSISPGAKAPSVAFAAHLLAQFDGATIISRDGRLMTTGIHLAPTPKAVELIPALAGTRHTSARRASFDLSDALIITVSADGPITVFSDGLNIFEFRWFSADESAAWIHRVSGKATRDAVWTSAHEAVCPRCGKTSHVEVLTVAGWRDHEEAHCPVCNEKIAEDHCYEIHANIRKVF